VLEAMSSGVCVVASDIPGNQDLIRNRENGILVPAGDAEALAAAIRSIAENPELRMRLALSGYETAQAYSWEETARATGQVLASATAITAKAPER
jgi:glycosyltransferase involved in cell wall biosynthesis